MWSGERSTLLLVIVCLMFNNSVNYLCADIADCLCERAVVSDCVVTSSQL